MAHQFMKFKDIPLGKTFKDGELIYMKTENIRTESFMIDNFVGNAICLKEDRFNLNAVGRIFRFGRTDMVELVEVIQ